MGRSSRGQTAPARVPAWAICLRQRFTLRSFRDGPHRKEHERGTDDGADETARAYGEAVTEDQASQQTAHKRARDSDHSSLPPGSGLAITHWGMSPPEDVQTLPHSGTTSRGVRRAARRTGHGVPVHQSALVGRPDRGQVTVRRGSIESSGTWPWCPVS